MNKHGGGDLFKTLFCFFFSNENSKNIFYDGNIITDIFEN